MAAFFATSAMAAEQKPTLLGSFRDWHAYRVGTGAERLCYALSQPKETNPKDLKRESVFFLISTWPGRRIQNEPSVVPGYPYKDGGMAEVQVGSDKFSLFTKNDAQVGGAWMAEATGEKKLIDSMKRGSAMSITGISSGGVLTRDNYSLAGISAALDSIATGCK
jgi:hypothetical protein